eukprot:scaffold2272_cov35-Cyclotella_meneghiniana.AAC.4
MAELELRGCGDGGQKRREKGVRTSAAIGTVWPSSRDHHHRGCSQVHARWLGGTIHLRREG